jgi:uncharacterized delta-60 repeat protein
MTARRDAVCRWWPSAVHWARAVALAVAATIIAGTAAAAGNPRDGTFGDRGVALVNLGGADRAVAGFRLESGRYLLVGHTKDGDDGRIALARLLPGGGLDSSFGDGGRLVVAGIAIQEAEAAALAPDGRIVVAVRGTDDHHALVRLRADGSPDPSFGADGVVRTASDSFMPATLVVQPNGRILLSTDRLERYTEAGELDPTFGKDGVVRDDNFDGTVLRQGNGDVVSVGPCGACLVGRRWDSDGTRDRDFGRAIDDNAFISVWPRYDLTGWPIAGAIDGRGRIFLASLAGKGSARPGRLDGLVVAFTHTGKPARGFHRDGWRTIDFGEREWLSAIEPLPGGRLLVAGTRTPGRTLPSDAIVLAMLNADGSLRHRFGNRGRAMLRAGTGRESPQATDLFLDGDRAIVVGEAGGDFLAARYRLAP